jgi:hypothetical protein
MLHVYCTSGMWSEALSVLDDVAAGRMGSISSISGSSISSRPRWQGDYNNRDAEVREELLGLQAAAAARVNTGPSRTGSGWRSRKYEEDVLHSDDDALEASSSSSIEQRRQQREQLAHDKLWHVVLRQLWQARASDTLLNDFLSRMSPQQLQRFKLLYNLRSLPDGKYSMQPLSDWEVQEPPTSQQQQQQQQQEVAEAPAVEQVEPATQQL